MATTLTDIQSALSSCFPGQGLNLQVNQTGSQLSVMINRPANQTGINYDDLAETVLAKLRSLDLPNVTTIKMYGRPANSKQVEWQTSQAITTPSTKPVTNGFTNSLSNGSNGSNGKSLVSQKPKSKFQEYLQQFSHYSNVISAASLLGILLLLGFSTLAGQKTPQAVEYEYKVQSVPDLSFTSSMNAIGADGWELVFARRAQDSTTEDFSYECIFKRVKK